MMVERICRLVLYTTACISLGFHRGPLTGADAFVSPTTKTPLHASSRSLHALDNQRPIDHPQKFYPQQTPHSQRHFDPSEKKRKRFMEGWYYRLTLRQNSTSDENLSFAIILSIEDPFEPTDLTLAACQIMGPHDEYLIQSTTDATRFWAWEHSQALGCTFHPRDTPAQALSKPEFHRNVSSGFQIFPDSMHGVIHGHDGSHGVHEGIPANCSFDFRIQPLVGWGGALEKEQRSTAGWLASKPVFEPHWQVTMADARATGFITWKNETYTFRDQPLYAEKNWGGTFPTKWYWVQCNSFRNYHEKQLSLTAGGGIRALPLGQTEEVGMIGVHYRNTFYEAVPWTGAMSWQIHPWGKWIMSGRCTGSTSPSTFFEVELEAICREPGVLLRAPTAKDGLVYFCRDSFYADLTLSLWKLEYSRESKEFVRKEVVVDKACSSQAAVEIGGGPWYTEWKGTSAMKQPMRAMVKFPYIMDYVKGFLRNKLPFRRSDRNKK